MFLANKRNYLVAIAIKNRSKIYKMHNGFCGNFQEIFLLPPIIVDHMNNGRTKKEN